MLRSSVSTAPLSTKEPACRSNQQDAVLQVRTLHTQLQTRALAPTTQWQRAWRWQARPGARYLSALRPHDLQMRCNCRRQSASSALALVLCRGLEKERDGGGCEAGQTGALLRRSPVQCFQQRLRGDCGKQRSTLSPEDGGEQKAVRTCRARTRFPAACCLLCLGVLIGKITLEEETRLHQVRICGLSGPAQQSMLG